ncbi:MAG: polysaccharide deacetylase family protein [Bdellovibrionaceae bacterium]|nr:polysaccharide deacetylase family protein [Pseudobdellovibrionaceae bacterium]
MIQLDWTKKIAAASLAMTLGLTACTGNQDNNAGELSVGTDANQLFQTKSIADFDLRGTKKIVLTYDDGPTPGVTEPLLDLLRKYNIKATFFMLGQAVKGQEATLRRMKADGHILANHSYSHANLSKNIYYLDINSLLHEVRDSNNKIQPFMNPAHRMYFRAPYGAWTASHAAKLNQMKDLKDYIGPVFWNAGGEITPRGTRPQSSSQITTAADWDCWTNNPKKNIRPVPVDVCTAGYFKEITSKGGGVVLLHDKNIKTVELSAKLIPMLLNAGYTFVNLDDVRSLDKYE